MTTQPHSAPLRLFRPLVLAPGQTALLLADGRPGEHPLAAGGFLASPSALPPSLPIGALIGGLPGLAAPALSVIGRLRLSGESVAREAVMAEALVPVDLPVGELPARVSRKGPALAWITLSDKGSRGERVDASGPRIEESIAEAMPLSLAQGYLLPDDARALRALVTDLALFQGFDLIVTTGGTGLGPRDVSPDAIAPLLDKRLHGFESLMLQAGLAKTPHAAISRAVAGTIGHAIVITLPGSPRAVAENLAPLLPAIPHALAKLQGDPADCARAG